MSYTSQADPMQAMVNAMTPKFAVSYLRVSTRGQAERGGGADEGFSIPAQREANKRKALSMGAMVGKEFVDRGASARSADRPELQKMLEYIKENADRVDYVIVHKVDRLARNRGDDIDIMRTLDECDVQLVSASESIDNSPSGMLLHGIMSAIAEFYSQNLATEVKKGMGEKIKNGGTVGRAPIGYKNVRDIDEKGREARTVAIDPERAPLIKLAFEEYSTGQWTVADLAEHLAACGLNTRSTPRISSQPITLKTLHKVLVNPYYKGVVTYKGVEYPGSHEPLVSTEIWEKVQTILASRVNGERNFKHPHFLKSSIYCACCGERMMVSNEKKKDGTVYPYFVCAGRHSKRHPECTTKAVLISAVEEAIEQIYISYQLPAEVRVMLEKQVTALIENEKEKYKKELNGLKGQKAKLENKRQKLLEAHYSNAIPLDLLKAEQQKIAKELATIEHEIRIHNTTFEAIIDNLKAALDIVENCGETYRYADDATKRLMNQAIFKRFLVSNDSENGLKVDAELASPFAQLQEPIKDDLIRINHASPERAKTLLDTIKAHLRAYFGDGLYDDVLSANSSSKGKNLVDTSKLEKSDKNTISSADCQDARQSEDKKKSASNFSDADLPYKSAFIETHSNPSNFFGSNISSKGVLVDLAGIEPASESLSIQASPITVILLAFPLCHAG